MLQHQKLTLEGRHHSGIDDCYNAVRIAQQMIKDGFDPVNSFINIMRPINTRPNKSNCRRNNK